MLSEPVLTILSMTPTLVEPLCCMVLPDPKQTILSTTPTRVKPLYCKKMLPEPMYTELSTMSLLTKPQPLYCIRMLPVPE